MRWFTTIETTNEAAPMVLHRRSGRSTEVDRISRCARCHCTHRLRDHRVIRLAGLGRRHRQRTVIAQLGEVAEHAGWQRLIGIAIQITSAAGLLGFGTIAAWTVGREFTDGTINALFALPVSRAHIARAKLTVVAAWAMIVALCMPFALAVPATLLGYGLPDSEAVDGLVRLIALGVLSALLASAAAWTATLGRSLLPGIAVTIAMIASAQVAVVAGTGAWYPVAAPALWAIKPGTVTALQLSLVGIVAGVFAYLTARSWARLQLDR